MTSSQIRQSFLDFFKSKQHTIVPSSSLMPDAPNLLFTNAGMNQFVPIFLGQRKPDVSRWAGAVPGLDTRAADTQKCIRAGGKHNDLDDVGLDTYHHTFFEMLGNWSFGDYFKKEAIEWAWELVVETWNFPPSRLYATVYCPDFTRWESEIQLALELVEAGSARIAQKDKPPSGGSAVELTDREAAQYWVALFKKAGLDPAIHVRPGGRKDNFWMMGDTGPCGPCSELHVDLTPFGDTKGSLVNQGDSRCIEIWNLVFIQFNAEPDGPEEAAKMLLPNAKAGVDWKQRFVPLPSKHVDTGMGFERVTSIIQGTKGLKDFANAKISNYETDIFRPIFDVLEKLSGKKYWSTLPGSAAVSRTEPLKSTGESPSPIIEVDGDTDISRAVMTESKGPTADQIATDIAFRVIADHIRTLSFAIADGIQPGIKGRNGVLRSIHKRMLRYASTIDIEDELLLRTQDTLVDTLGVTMGGVFPEIRKEREHIKQVLREEASIFNRTLNQGLNHFASILRFMESLKIRAELCSKPNAISSLCDLFKKDGPYGESQYDGVGANRKQRVLGNYFNEIVVSKESAVLPKMLSLQGELEGKFSGEAAFLLYDTYGFPLDLTEVMARERGLIVDKEDFDRLMEEQRSRARAAQRKEVVELSGNYPPTEFVGFDRDEADCEIEELITQSKGKSGAEHWAVVSRSPLYAEMGGQVGDTGLLYRGHSPKPYRVLDTIKKGNTFYLKLDVSENAMPGSDLPWPVQVGGESGRLVLDKPRRDAIQRHHTVTHLLHWALHEIVSKEASQKGSLVGPDKLTFDFNSAPLTPQQVADIEKLVNERILENAGVSWTEVPYAQVKGCRDVMQFFGDKYGDTVRVVQVGGHAQKLDGYSMELCGGTHTRATGEIGLFRIVGESAIAAGVRRIEAVAGLEAYRKSADEVSLIKSLAGKVNSPIHELDKKIEALLAHQREMEKLLKSTQQREASNAASRLLEEVQTVNGIPAIIHNLGAVDGDFLQAVADSLKGRFKGVIVLGGSRESVALVAAVTPEYTAKVQAGKIIQQIAPIVGGKGGGKPDNARGGGKDASKLEEALAKAKSLIG